MKSNRLIQLSLLILASAFTACKHESHDTPVSLDGVWEGPMTINEDGTSLRVLSIDGNTAEFIDFDYTLAEGYNAVTRQSSPIDVVSRNNGCTEFEVTVDGSQMTLARKDSLILGPENNKVIFRLTKDGMDRYQATEPTESLLPEEIIFSGPESHLMAMDSGVLDAFDFNWMEFLEWAVKTAGTTAYGKGVGALLDLLFPASGETTTLDDLLDKMNAITDQLNQMTLLYKNTTYEAKLNERSKYVSELTNYNEEYYVRLSNAKTEEEVATIISDWASHTVGGNPVYVQGLNFIDFLLNTVIEQRDIFNMYDLYTYNTTAWENEGYSVREALRAGDIAVAAENLYLTQLYYTLRTDMDEDSKKTMLDKNIEKFNLLAEYIKNRPVEHHDDKAICQIPGAHFVMDAVNFTFQGSSTYKNPSWCRIPREWMEYDDDMDFIYGPNKTECYNKSLTPDEVKHILDYYDGTGWTLAQIFILKAKCRLSMLPLQTIILTLQSKGYSADAKVIGLNQSVDFYAKSSSEIGPKSVGKGYFETKGSFYYWYLEFVRWDSFNENQFWIRTNVLER